MKKAVLLIHDFALGLKENEYLMNYVNLEKDLQVFAITLEGELKDAKKLEYSTLIKKVFTFIEFLIQKKYQTIYLIGHGMGGILASIAAIKYQEIKKIVYLNTPLDSLTFQNQTINILENKDYKDYIGLIDEELNTTIPNFLEYVKLIKEYHDCFSQVKCEALVLQSLDDKLILTSNANDIYKKLSSKQKYLTFLKQQEHIVFDTATCNDNKEEIALYIIEFLKERNFRKIWKETI